ncbi:MAG: aminotransferase class V-fold PLP-dependent enzyme [Actinobacteria bacterium]|nr:aminotransferase class V-fold PLP-dependent enzyme [Actinomycetota bacterium]
MNLKPHFSRFLESDPERLHFAAHSHHPWPDVSYQAHQRAWEDAARLMDDKWEHVFGVVVPSARRLVAGVLGLSDPETLVFAPNTHELVVRVFSCIEPPVRVLTTDSEFHSFNRQLRRWEEAGLAIADRVPVAPYESFSDRFTQHSRAGVHDLIYLSEVFYDSAMVVTELDRIVSSISEERAFVVVDGYHAFMARPVDLGAIQDRAFYVAGGYKYAMAGEGACFLHCPPGYGMRPVDTGWYAGFGELETGVSQQVRYAKGGARFYGATFDPSGVYRLESVLGWLQDEGITPVDISRHARSLMDRLVASEALPGKRVVPADAVTGNFLTVELDEAERVYRALHDRRVITDHRGNRLRIGFGIYQDEEDVDRLAGILEALRAAA